MSSFERSLEGIIGSKLKGKKINQKVIDGVLSLVLQSENSEEHLEELEPLLDDHLWPLLSPESTDTHIILIAAILQSKLTGEKKLYLKGSEKLHVFLTRSIQIFTREDSSYQVRSFIVRSLHVLFLNLSDPLIRKATAPLVSILAWSKSHDLEALLAKHSQATHYSGHLNKLEELPQKERIERLLFSNWIPSLLSDVTTNIRSQDPYFKAFAANVFVLLTCLLGQLPTRRFLRSLVLDYNIVPIARPIDSQPKYSCSLDLLEFYLKFPIDDFTGAIVEPDAIGKIYSNNILKLQLIAFRSFKEKLGDLAFAAQDTFKDHKKLTSTLSHLTDEELVLLLAEFDIRFKESFNNEVKIESLIFQLEPYYDTTSYLGLYNSLPTEQTLSFSPSPPSLALPSLRGQFLSLSDFISRIYLLSREDSFAEIAQHVKRTVQRFELKKDKNKEKLQGSSKHAVKISTPKFVVSTPTLLESEFSVIVQGNIKVDLNNAPQAAVQEWNALEKGHVVLLLRIDGRDNKSDNEVERLGLGFLRSGVIQEKLTNSGDLLTKISKSFNLKINLDAQAYSSNKEPLESYEKFNVMIKLPQHLSGFRIKLQEILKHISTSEEKLPDWLYEGFLGFGDPNAGQFNRIAQPVTAANFLASGYTAEDIQKSFPDFQVTIEDNDPKRRRTNSKNAKSSLEQTSPFSVNVQGREIVLKENEYLKGYQSTLNSQQLQAVIASLFEGLIVVDGAAGTGKKTIVAEMLKGWSRLSGEPKTLIVAKSETHLSEQFEALSKIGIDSSSHFNFSDKLSQLSLAKESLKRLESLLRNVDDIATATGVEGAYSDSVETGLSFFKFHIRAKWIQYLSKVKNEKSSDTVLSEYPFHQYGSLDEAKDDSIESKMSVIVKHYQSICQVFDELETWAPLEFLRSNNEIVNYIFSSKTKVIGTTVDELYRATKKIEKAGIVIENVIVSEASQLTQFESLFPIFSQNSNSVKRFVLVGDTRSLAPTSFSSQLSSMFHLNTSLIKRFKELRRSFINLDVQYNRRREITTVLEANYPNLVNQASEEFKVANAGILSPVQFIHVEGSETQPIQQVYQNVQEAEYAVQLYQYLRLLGYPSQSVSVLTSEEGQQALLEEVFSTRCGEGEANDELSDFRFGYPLISTVRNFRARESDVVIFSSVRSQIPDESFITAAISSAKRGVYILGSQELLENVMNFENDSILKNLVKATEGHKLRVVVGEMYTSVTRRTVDEVDSYQMENLEHISQFVQQMTEKRLKAGEKKPTGAS